MFPASATSGLSMTFPDVCKMPRGSPMLVPIPYPNLAKTAKTAQQTKKQTKGKPVLTTKSGFSMSQGAEAGVQKGILSHTLTGEITQIKTQIDVLNGKLLSLQSDDPDKWQEVLQNYMVMVSALYVTIQNSRG